jgi:chemotaxis protein MotB
MSGPSNMPPVIIRRKKMVAGGHHGGAWKVAYADFVTAMMAFFLLMWLVNATTETQRKGLADFFSPSVPLIRASGGGEGVFAGDSIMSENTMAQVGIGATNRAAMERRQARGDSGADSSDSEGAGDNELLALEEALKGLGGESREMENLLKHVITRITDEGLIVEIFDLEGAPLFEPDTDSPTWIAEALAGMLARVFDLTQNGVAVDGHTRNYPIVLRDNPVWNLSATRAEKMRTMLVEKGLVEARMQRVTGKADRQPATDNPMAVRNNRLEVILLRRTN